MTKNDFRKLATSVGARAMYSGKEKTFYIHPSDRVEVLRDMTRHQGRWFIKPA